jgi:hypothetical protein
MRSWRELVQWQTEWLNRPLGPSLSLSFSLPSSLAHDLLDAMESIDPEDVELDPDTEEQTEVGQDTEASPNDELIDMDMPAETLYIGASNATRVHVGSFVPAWSSRNDAVEENMGSLVPSTVGGFESSRSIHDSSARTGPGATASVPATSSFPAKNTTATGVEIPAHIRKATVAQEGDQKCTVCHENKVDSVVFPCTHAQVCFQCTLEWLESRPTCPHCRKRVTHLYQTFT